MNRPLDRAWILAHIPHQGAMCLNDSVESWDDEHLCCTAWSHRDPDNPLRADGRLGALAGIEYAAQAVAIHGALLGAGAVPGMLGSVRNLVCECARLDRVQGALRVAVTRLGGDRAALLYRFELRGFELQGEGRRLMHGRLTIVLAPPCSRPT